VKRISLLAAVPAILIVLAGCGSAGKSTTSASAGPYGKAAAATTTTSTTSTTSSNAAATTVLISAKHSKDGTILAMGPKHMTVYLFEADKGGTSACSGACAGDWPPVIGQAQAGSGASASQLGQITRSDGTKQVTYNGHPLYLFAKDEDSGDAYGQGVKAFGAEWYVLSPSGNKVDES